MAQLSRKSGFFCLDFTDFQKRFQSEMSRGYQTSSYFHGTRLTAQPVFRMLPLSLSLTVSIHGTVLLKETAAWQQEKNKELYLMRLVTIEGKVIFFKRPLK